MAIEIPLSIQGKYAGLYKTVIDDVDEDLANDRWHRMADNHGNIYARNTSMGLMHHVIVERMIGRRLQKNEMVSHVDNDTLNNRRANLHIVFIGEQTLQKPNKTGYRGVRYHRRSGKYEAKIKIRGKGHFLGCFDTPDEAHRAYEAARLKKRDIIESTESGQKPDTKRTGE